MKIRPILRIVPFVALLVVILALVACGDEGGTTSSTPTTSGATTTAGGQATTTESAGETSTTGEGGAATTVGGATSTTVAGMTSTTGAGGVPGVPPEIVVQLTGDEEVPPVETGATGTFTLILSTGEATGGDTTTSVEGAGGLLPAGLTLSFKLEVENMTDITAAHIHLGAKGQNGDVIYPLFTGPQKDGEFSGVLAEGPLNEADLTGPYKGMTFADLVTAVLQGETYVNVHTAANPNGEIRGQIIIETGTTTTGPAGTDQGATTTTAASGGATSTTAEGGY